MDIIVKGGQTLSGEITPSGSKNSALHILPATLLFHNKVTLKNIPNIKDVEILIDIIKMLGGKVDWDKDTDTVEIDNSNVSFSRLKENDLGNIKASALMWGGLLGRFKKVDVSDLPGGCTLGIRPVEPFFKSFRDMGVKITETGSGVKMDATHAGSKEIWMTEMAVSVTSTLIMLAVTLPGLTKITGVASEPQVQDLCRFLIKAGADIRGVGSSILEINGGGELDAVEHTIFSDHNEVATFLALSAVTGGGIKINNTNPEFYNQIAYEFNKFNVDIKYDGEVTFIEKNQNIKFTGSYDKKTNVVRAQPWPGFPVDLLPIMIPLAIAAPSGYMMFHNWMYEAGLFWTSELVKLGVEVIMCDPHRVIVMGGNNLKGATMEAPYIIRATVSMVMAAMLASGESRILDADALYRGHPHFAENLKKLGAKIDVIKESPR